MPKPLSGITPSPDSGDLLLVAAGDDAAVQRLLDRWRQPVYALFERSREPSAAADAAAEVFTALFRSAGKYDHDLPFPSHLYGLAARVIQKAPASAPITIAQQRLQDSAAARTALLRASVSALPPVERAAFLLTRVARLPLPTTASALGMSEGDLKKTIVRALESLRTPLKPLLDMPAEGAELWELAAENTIPSVDSGEQG